MSAFAPSHHAIVREIWQGKVWTVRALTAVRDDPNLIVLYQPARAPWKRPYSRDGQPLRLPLEEWALRDDTLPEDALRLIVPGEAHSALLIWRERWKLMCWYINLETPFRRTSIGFDYMDQTLDIIVSADLREWRWKDEEELAEAVALGIYTHQQANDIRAAGEQALVRFLARKPPFDRAWDQWRPDPAWDVPQLSGDWETAAQT